jgi:hypothetical protein
MRISDIALEFTAWIAVEFKLYLIKEFQRLKETERQTLGWDIRRSLAAISRPPTAGLRTAIVPPLQGGANICTLNPWRCPGLSTCAPSGLLSKRLIRIYERKLAALEVLKNSLLQQAFTGQL